jgi:hypothetical protein
MIKPHFAKERQYAAPLRWSASCVTDSNTMPDWWNERRIANLIEATDMFQRTYFIGWKGGPVKIGRAYTVKRRLLELQSGCPYRLHVWAITSLETHSEPRLHRRFHKHRMMGEWFAWHPAIEAMMATLNGAPAAVSAAIRNRENAEDGAEKRIV